MCVSDVGFKINFHVILSFLPKYLFTNIQLGLLEGKLGEIGGSFATHRNPSLDGSSWENIQMSFLQAVFNINDKAILDIWLLKPVHGQVGVCDGDLFDHTCDVMCTTKVEHFLCFSNTSNQTSTNKVTTYISSHRLSFEPTQGNGLGEKSERKYKDNHMSSNYGSLFCHTNI